MIVDFIPWKDYTQPSNNTLVVAWDFENTLIDLVNGFSFADPDPDYVTGSSAFDGTSYYFNHNNYINTGSQPELSIGTEIGNTISICTWVRLSGYLEYARWLQYSGEGINVVVDERGSYTNRRIQYYNGSSWPKINFSGASLSSWQMETLIIKIISSTDINIQFYSNDTLNINTNVAVPISATGTGSLTIGSSEEFYLDNYYCWINRELSASDVSDLFNSGNGRDYAWVTANLP